jgi:hypothetical protein
VEEFFEIVIVVVVVVMKVEQTSELVLVVIVGTVMTEKTVKTVKKISKFVFVRIVFVIGEVRLKFFPRCMDVLENAVKVVGLTPLRVHEELPDHARRLQELAVCHEGIQLVFVSAEHRDVRFVEEGEKLGVRRWDVRSGSMGFRRRHEGKKMATAVGRKL